MGGEDGGALLKRILIPIVLSVVLYFGSDFYFEQERDRMAEEKVAVETEKSKIQDELKRIKGFEAVKAELERNELVLKTKIATIEKLIVNRDFTLKTWVALSQSLPKDVWLTDLVVNDQGYAIRASTTDIGLVSDVMTRLGKTIYFKDVTLKQTTSEPNGKKSQFELTARKD
jgi:Tfp pilus assembly protein PilN